MTDPSMPDFLNSLEDYVPTVPDEFTEYFLERSGLDCKDTRLVRLVSLAAQKFIAGALHDAAQVRARRMKQAPARLKEAGWEPKDKRSTLLTEDLAQALAEYGLNLKRPPYYADTPNSAEKAK